MVSMGLKSIAELSPEFEALEKDMSEKKDHSS